MKILLLALTIVLSAMIGTMADPSRSRTDRFTSTHPDINKNIPIWTMITVSNKDFAIIRRLMGGPLISRNPIIRLWSNLTPDDKLKCPSCDGTFDTIVDNEIWLIDNATMDNLVVMIIMYYQINLRGMSDSMIFSTTAIGERKFFFDQWQSIINNPPQSYPEEFTP